MATAEFSKFAGILSATLSQHYLLGFEVAQLELEKVEEPEVKLPTSAASSKKQESYRKTSTYALWTMPKSLTV